MDKNEALQVIRSNYPTDRNQLCEALETLIPELKESEYGKPCGGIVLEDFNGGEGFYKVNLAYLNKEQVIEIEELVKKWNPELIESEDERVKNEIIAFVEQSIHRGGGTPIPQEQENRWIAWLEKQGELKPIFRVGDYIRNKKTKDRVLIEQIDIANKIYCYVSRDDAAEIHSDFRFSEQNDWEIIGQKIVGQKPTEWSEEDEKERKRVVGLLEGWLSTFIETYYAEDCKCGISWLNSLKQRMKGE